MGEFHTVAKTSEVAPGEMKLVVVGGDEIVIANVDGEYFAFSDTCSKILVGRVTDLWWCGSY